MEMVHKLVDAKIAKMRSDLDATIAAQRVLALAAKKPQGPKGRSNDKSSKSTKSRAKTKAAHKSRMAQKRRKG